MLTIRARLTCFMFGACLHPRARRTPHLRNPSRGPSRSRSTRSYLHSRAHSPTRFASTLHVQHETQHQTAMSYNYHSNQLPRMQAMQQYFGTACAIQADPVRCFPSSASCQQHPQTRPSQLKLEQTNECEPMKTNSHNSNSHQYTLLRHQPQQQQPAELLPRLGLNDEDLRVLAAILCVDDREEPANVRNSHFL